MEPRQPPKKRKHLSGSSKRQLATHKALKQAAADQKQKKLPFCLPSGPVGPHTGIIDEGDFSATAGASEPASATPNSVVSDDSNGDDVTPTTSLTSQFNDDDKVIGEYRVANEPICQNIKTDDSQSDTCISGGLSANDVIDASTVFANDKYRFDQSALNHKDHINWLVSCGACQPEKKDMPNHRFPNSTVKATQSRRASNRHFCSSYYFSQNSLNEQVKRPWLAYSFRGDYCYCHVCWLFGDAQAQSSTWVSGIRDWQHLSQSIEAHVKSKQHRHCVGAYATYAEGKSVDSQMRKIVLEEERKWNHILTQQFGLLRLLTGLGLPVRGHRETVDSNNPGVYLSLLRFMSNSDPTLAQHLAGDSRIKYVSKTIMEEQIKLLAREVHSVLIAECKAAKFYTVIVDGSPDISHKDQMAILLRYVAIDRNKKLVDIHERFIGYFQVIDGTAKGICNIIEKVLFEDCKLEHKYLTGQAYDGASVMSGSKGGVQAVMKDRLREKGNTFVPYVHCPPHQLNLVLLHAAESGHPMPPVEVLKFFDVVQSVYNYFSCSYRRWQHLVTSQSESQSDDAPHAFPDPNIEDDSDTETDTVIQQSVNHSSELVDIDESEIHARKPRTLKSLSTTRWSARKDATSALLAHFGSVVESLAVLIDDQHDADEVKQAHDLQYQLDWTFLLTLVWWNDVLLTIDSASRLLQAKRNDLFMVADCFRLTAVHIEELRSDLKFKEYMKHVTEMWLSLGFPADEATFKQTRIRRKKRMADEVVRDEVPVSALSAEDLYRTNVYFRVLDSMAGEIRSRSEGLQDVCELFGFLHSVHLSKISHMDAVQCVGKLHKRFPDYFTSELADEIVSFQMLYFAVNTSSTVNSSPIKYLQFIVDNELSDSFPQFEVLIRLFITLPIGIASAERSFSVLRRIKNYMRSTMSQDRTSDLAQLAIERDVAQQLDISSIIKQFSSCKVRRGMKLSS
jgi:hypothetical protein